MRRPKKDNYVGELSLRSKRRIKVLKGRRKIRAGETARGALGGAVLGGAAAAAAAEGKHFYKLLPVIKACAAAAAMGVGGGNYLYYSKKVHKATNLIGTALAKEAKKNHELRDFLLQYPYVVIDAEGNVKGTHRKRFLKMGRIRLDTTKILEGKYKKEKRKTS